MPLPTVGSAAPDFTLPSTSGKPLTLSALRGKHVMLAFFPLAFTGTCTAEMREFSEDYSKYQQAGTVILPISVDSVPTLKEFKAKEKMQVELLSDFKREVSRLYGTLHEEKFFSKRVYVLVDPGGKVRWVHEEADAGNKRNTRELLAELEKLSSNT